MAAHTTGSTGSSRGASSRDRHSALGPPIPWTQARQILKICTPVKCCPRCSQKLGYWISWTEEHLGMRFYRCNEQVKGVPCGYLEWIDDQHGDYMKLVLSSLRDAVWDSKEECNRLSKELNDEKSLWRHAEELKYKEQLENRATFHKLEEKLEIKTGKIQKLEEQLENKARRGRWFSMVLCFLSVCFGLFVGGAMEAGRSN